MEGTKFRRGVQYEVASGELIDKGEKQFEAHNEAGQVRKITAQVCNVSKALLSIRNMAAAGNRVVLEEGGGYIEDVQSGERLRVMKEGGIYMLRLWARSPFHGQAARNTP